MMRFDGQELAASTAIAKQDQIEYLYKLPIELWFDILSAALLPIPPDLPFVFDAFSLTTLPRSEVVFALQKRRFRFLTICKTLLPIIEQLLFTDVTIRGQDKYLLLMSRADSDVDNHVRRGSWTKRLYISARYWEKLILQLGPFLSTFPNLISLDIAYKVIVRPYQPCWIGPENISLKHLLWRSSSFSWETLQLISTQFPNLTQLGLFTCLKSNKSQDTSVMLKSLKHFIISCEPIRYLDLAQLVMPTLSTIKMDIEDHYSHLSDNFLLQHGPVVTELQLNDLVYGDQSIPTKPRGFDSTFPLLQVFTFNPIIFKPISPSTESVATPHEQLKHLRLALDWVYKDTRLRIQQHAQYFSLTRFPNLRLITAILVEAEHKEDVVAFLSEVFPHAIVNFDVVGIEYSSI